MDNKRNKTLHMLLSSAGLSEHKESLVLGASDQRTGHSSELTDREADALISYLETQTRKREIPGGPAAERLRKRLIAIGHNIGKHPNAVKNWCEKQGAFGNKKKFNDYTPQELRCLAEIYEKVVVFEIHKAQKQLQT